MLTSAKHEKSKHAGRARGRRGSSGSPLTSAVLRDGLRLLFVLAVLAAAWGSVGAPGAVAARGHAFGFDFPQEGETSLGLVSLPGTLGVGSGVAVDEATHDVYVADTANHRVDEFSAAGVFLLAWGWGVSNGAAELQVCTSACQPGLSGSAPGEFESPVYVTVDPAGDVYVGDSQDDLVSKFDSEGHLVGSWGNNGENAAKEHVEPNGQLNGETTPQKESFNPKGIDLLAGIATDTAGDLWVFTSETQLFEFAGSSSFVKSCWVSSGYAVRTRGIDVNSGFVYFATGLSGVLRISTSECSAKDSATAAVKLTGGRSTAGLAIDAGGGDLFVDGEGELLEDFPGECALSGSNCGVSQTIEEGDLQNAAGVGSDDGMGRIYVANTGTQQIAVFVSSVEATPAPATGVQAHSAVLHGAVNPLGSELSKCEFEYGETEAFGSVVPCEQSPGSIGQGGSSVPVQAQIGSLPGGATYHFRLRAVNGRGEVRSEDEHFQTPITAVVSGVQASVAGSTASLIAKVDPRGIGSTAYHFEYGPCTTLATCPASPYPETLPGGTLPAVSSEEQVSAQPTGLAAHTIYHFRVVAEDENGVTAPTPEGTFVLEPATAGCAVERPQSGSERLPDCRAYEMVTPLFKNGAAINNGNFLGPSIAHNGSTVFAKSIQCFAQSASCVGDRQTEGEPFDFQRGQTGWTARSLAPPATFTGTTMISYDADTGRVLYQAPPAEGLPEDFYIREPDGNLKTVGRLSENPGFDVNALTAFNADYSHIAYAAPGLWDLPGAEPAENDEQAYEYTGVGDKPMLVAVTGSSKASTSLISACGATLGGGHGLTNGRVGTVSEAGRTVIFTAVPCSHGTGENEATPVPAATIYERVEHADGSMGTVSVSGSAATCGQPCAETRAANAKYEGASADGSRVFFSSTQRLTADASEDPRTSDSATNPQGCSNATPGTSGCNLYIFECPAHCENESDKRLVDASAGDRAGIGPRVQGVMAVAEDGASVYFVARGVLTGANGEGVTPRVNGLNLYAWGPGQDGKDRVAFVATLSASDSELWEAGVFGANVSPDGRYLVFRSHRALTRDASRLEGPAQVYRYDEQSERLLRVSIGSEGYDDNGNDGSGDARVAEPGHFFAGHGRLDPTMSDDGRFVFFESPVGLTPDALNDETVVGSSSVLAENVYEWEADGAKASAGGGTCGQPGGCVWLISDGRDRTRGSDIHNNESAVELVGSDASGSNVFFITADQLVAGDKDAQLDIYDARVGGGFPAEAEQEPCDSLEGCHGPVGVEEPVVEGLPSGLLPAVGNYTGPGIVELSPGGGVSRRSLTAAALLRRALAACEREHVVSVRRVCERHARAAYRARLLAKALAACHRKHGNARGSCERRAQRQYGAVGRSAR